MPVSKVNSNYQVTIPKEVREKARISKGDSVMVEYDEDEAAVMVRPPLRGTRGTLKLGSGLTVKDIEESIARGQNG